MTLLRFRSGLLQHNDVEMTSVSKHLEMSLPIIVPDLKPPRCSSQFAIRRIFGAPGRIVKRALKIMLPCIPLLSNYNTRARLIRTEVFLQNSRTQLSRTCGTCSAQRCAASWVILNTRLAPRARRSIWCQQSWDLLLHCAERIRSRTGRDSNLTSLCQHRTNIVCARHCTNVMSSRLSLTFTGRFLKTSTGESYIFEK